MVKRQVSSAYHPKSQGALERFHETCCLCRILIVQNYPRNREEGPPWLMLAYMRCNNRAQVSVRGSSFGFAAYYRFTIPGKVKTI